MRKRLEEHIREFFPEMLEEPFLLACSGGVDSTVLAHLLKELGLRFELAHCNFQLRGSESDADAAFVGHLADQLNIKYHSKSFDTKDYALENKLSVQVAARELRYAWFHRLLESEGLSFAVTAHHADDDLETFLINLVRGAGLEGLTGIPARAPGIRRPFLAFSAAEILAYAKEAGLEWREDSSNREEKYLRNRLRKKVIPALKAVDPRFEANFRKSQHFLKGSEALVRNHIKRLRKQLFSRKGQIIRVSVASLKRLSPNEAYLYEFFHPYGFTDWEALQRLLDGSSGKQLVSPTHVLLRDRTHLLLRPVTPDETTCFEIDLTLPGVAYPIALELSKVPERGPASKDVLYVDAETLKEGLQLRKWRKGDYFYPLGMQGKQKVSKFFKDRKYNQFEKEAQWLLCSGNDIVWIVGRRADDRFKVRKDTKQILRIQWTDSE